MSYKDEGNEILLKKEKNVKWISLNSYLNKKKTKSKAKKNTNGFINVY